MLLKLCQRSNCARCTSCQRTLGCAPRGGALQCSRDGVDGSLQRRRTPTAHHALCLMGWNKQSLIQTLLCFCDRPLASGGRHRPRWPAARRRPPAAAPPHPGCTLATRRRPRRGPPARRAAAATPAAPLLCQSAGAPRQGPAPAPAWTTDVLDQSDESQLVNNKLLDTGRPW